MFKEKTFRLVALLIAITIILSFALPIISKTANAANTYSETKKNISNLEKKLSDLDKKNKELESNIKTSSNKIKSQTEQKEKLDRSINLLQEEIDVQTKLISEYNKQIADLEKQSNELQAQIDERFELFKARVRANFEAGQTSFLEVILCAKDFSDLLVRIDMAQAIMKFDKKLVEDLTNDKKEIEEIKQLKEESRAKEQSTKASLEQKKKELDKKRSESLALIKKLQTDVNEYKAALEENEKLEEEFRQQLQKELSALSKLQEYVGGEFTWPCPGYTRITSEFGWRNDPISKKRKYHSGIDIGAPTNAKVVAANSGVVIKAGYHTSYGNYVVIDHGGGKSTLYAHLTSYSVSVNDTVVKGQEIGKVGTTGYSTGPHLHFEIRESGNVVNPLNYYKKQ